MSRHLPGGMWRLTLTADVHADDTDAVQVDCCDYTNPVKVELITDKRPDVDQRVFVTVTFYGETL